MCSVSRMQEHKKLRTSVKPDIQKKEKTYDFVHPQALGILAENGVSSVIELEDDRFSLSRKATAPRAAEQINSIHVKSFVAGSRLNVSHALNFLAKFMRQRSRTRIFGFRIQQNLFLRKARNIIFSKPW